MSGISVKLVAFEGPLDLLLHLIEKNKVNIYDIPIVEITEQYMDYIREMEKQDMDSMSEFLVMAATLLRIKSQMLLPVEPKEDEAYIDPRQELVARLLEYKMYQYISGELRDRQVDASRVLFKESTLPPEIADYKEEIDVNALLSDLSLQRLQGIFQSVMQRQVEKIDPIRSKFGRIEREEINLADKIMDIQRYGLAHKRFSFRTLLERQTDKMEVIVAFLGILELMKMGRVQISQEELFDDILIEYVAEDIAPVEQFSAIE